MKNIHTTIKSVLLACACMTGLTSFAQDKPEKITFCFDDRFIANEEIDLTNIDSISFEKTSMKRYKYLEATGNVLKLSKSYRTDGVSPYSPGIWQPRSHLLPQAGRLPARV